ncbi:TetR/AcrR family transcriptional regulator [Halomonas sp. FeN2]|jgi:TetR/AcrR family transcriptional regulator, transcriptional repressor for nem operon|uniref:TetR/AcrR family transcriptional regulator n=1 Tax=Vreelandella neptunia TaxID=115551 RepID=A0ABZ0YIP7_9GAMM|nr:MULTISPECIES: TetR/AcrR family transcriptional regulator [Halomonas]TDV99994.1 TetR family transcriptional regulator [Halomonas alkaliantarctica]MBF60160.1 TetR family transcriptional regulator [Halomonas sp.]MDN3559679.1 TetR/AcrR family transcriptional regulator [Halomonas neptunia]UBR51016.1 TetR/AcrR family transcriptional regulator [Halomonas sp. FeN2]WQH11544.1 TetR/AcrR family transcriptional regulator [Halomonas neptunia]|tara:strand:- start:268 stop:909 length:642 start_codon:yes stop_codon:yes gene_type:complete
MPYPKSHKSKTKERILASATELFSRNGFQKVSIGQIMKLAKMTHGAFYAHFASKEALYNESVRLTIDNSRAARLVKGPLSLQHLTELVANYCNLQELEAKHKPGPEAVLFNEIGSEKAEIRTLFEASYMSMKKMLETRLIALSKLKQLPFANDRKEIADKSRVILASLVGAVAIAKSLPGEVERKQVLVATQRQILLMLGVSEAEAERMMQAQ